MKFTAINFSILIFLLTGLMFINACKPVKSLTTMPSPWSGNSKINSKMPGYDSSKKTVFIIADYKLTEIFDMLAPFYLFNATGKANVYIVANDRTPILIKKDLFVSPQITFNEADSLQLVADVIVIPALSIRDEHQDTVIISWIKEHFTSNTKLLTICEGAATGAATGLYDGKPITTHATDFNQIKSHFDKPVWVQNVSVAREGNIFSTAGVSNAVEGSLVVIDELFGAETAKQVANDIHYPQQEAKLAHQSMALSNADKFTVAKKIIFRKNRNIGVLLDNGVNEFAMASMIDTYGRSFPASFTTFILHDTTIRTRFGLSLIHTGRTDTKKLDELHVIMPESFSPADQAFFGKTNVILYNSQQQYLFDVYFKRIGQQYGRRYEKFLKVSLDYN